MKQLFKKYSTIYPDSDLFAIMYRDGEDNSELYSHDKANNAASYLGRRILLLFAKTELIVSACKACEYKFHIY